MSQVIEIVPEPSGMVGSIILECENIKPVPEADVKLETNSDHGERDETEQKYQVDNVIGEQGTFDTSCQKNHISLIAPQITSAQASHTNNSDIPVENHSTSGSCRAIQSNESKKIASSRRSTWRTHQSHVGERILTGSTKELQRRSRSTMLSRQSRLLISIKTKLKTFSDTFQSEFVFCYLKRRLTRSDRYVIIGNGEPLVRLKSGRCIVEEGELNLECGRQEYCPARSDKSVQTETSHCRDTVKCTVSTQTESSTPIKTAANDAVKVGETSTLVIKVTQAKSTGEVVRSRPVLKMTPDEFCRVVKPSPFTCTGTGNGPRAKASPQITAPTKMASRGSSSRAPAAVRRDKSTKGSVESFTVISSEVTSGVENGTTILQEQAPISPTCGSENSRAMPRRTITAEESSLMERTRALAPRISSSFTGGCEETETGSADPPHHNSTQRTTGGDSPSENLTLEPQQIPITFNGVEVLSDADNRLKCTSPLKYTSKTQRLNSIFDLHLPQASVQGENGPIPSDQILTPGSESHSPIRKSTRRKEIRAKRTKGAISSFLKVMQSKFSNIQDHVVGVSEQPQEMSDNSSDDIEDHCPEDFSQTEASDPSKSLSFSTSDIHLDTCRAMTIAQDPSLQPTVVLSRLNTGSIQSKSDVQKPCMTNGTDESCPESRLKRIGQKYVGFRKPAGSAKMQRRRENSIMHSAYSRAFRTLKKEMSRLKTELPVHTEFVLHILKGGKWKLRHFLFGEGEPLEHWKAAEPIVGPKVLRELNRSQREVPNRVPESTKVTFLDVGLEYESQEERERVEIKLVQTENEKRLTAKQGHRTPNMTQAVSELSTKAGQSETESACLLRHRRLIKTIFVTLHKLADRFGREFIFYLIRKSKKNVQHIIAGHGEPLVCLNSGKCILTMEEIQHEKIIEPELKCPKPRARQTKHLLEGRRKRNRELNDTESVGRSKSANRDIAIVSQKHSASVKAANSVDKVIPCDKTVPKSTLTSDLATPDTLRTECSENILSAWRFAGDKPSRTKDTTTHPKQRTEKRSPCSFKRKIKKVPPVETKRRKSSSAHTLSIDHRSRTSPRTKPISKQGIQQASDVINCAELGGEKLQRNSAVLEETTIPDTHQKKKQKIHDQQEMLSSDTEKSSKLPLDGATDEYELEIFRLSSKSSTKKERVCRLCEKPTDLIQCKGPCNAVFHPTCLGLTVPHTGVFTCAECISGCHACFICKVASGDTERCSAPRCERYYHAQCLQKFNQVNSTSNSNNTCSLHACATCALNSSGLPAASEGRLYKCVRCPTAYHVGDFCIAAGCIHLAGLNIVCSRHFQPLKSQSHHSHINVDWCFICSKGGTLLCCESCPAAFHADCLRIDLPSDKWYCADCSRDKRPRYGEIVWVKVGNYRWWPAEICLPKNVPQNIQNKAHQAGEFPVRFFGSYDYLWTHQGRVMLFQDGDRGSRDTSNTSYRARLFNKAMSEVTVAYKSVCAARAERKSWEQEGNGRKPASYKHVKSNIPIGPVVIHKADVYEVPHCDCKPDDRNPCGLNSECLNQAMMYECHPVTCPAKERCQNQRFTKRLYPACQPFKVPGRGWGLQALEDIKKGSFIHEYVGDLVDEEECRHRIKDAHDHDIFNFYMLTLDKNRIIDAGPKGNFSRFMNHSCRPNCETQKWTVMGDVRVGLFAKQDIHKGSELTFNYNLECLGNEKKVCHCGATNCSGFLGVQPKVIPGEDGVKKTKTKRKNLILNKGNENHGTPCSKVATELKRNGPLEEKNSKGHNGAITDMDTVEIPTILTQETFEKAPTILTQETFEEAPTIVTQETSEKVPTILTRETFEKAPTILSHEEAIKLLADTSSDEEFDGFT